MKVFLAALAILLVKGEGNELTSDEILSTAKVPTEKEAEHSIDFMLKKAGKGKISQSDVTKETSWSGAGVFDEKLRWTKGIIPYKFSSDYKGVDVSMIYSSMKEWMEKTCIKFEPFNAATIANVGHENYIEFHNDQGCWSQVGMVGNGVQWVSLQRPGCMYHQVSLHELGHAIGLHHEQCRLDRDQYLNIHWENVWPNMKYNFQRMLDTSNYSIPYDYCSIMQYGAWAFGMGSGFTIVPKDITYIFTMGKSMHLTFSDEKVVNIMYKCDKECPKEKKASCKAPCFVNHKCECRCPDNECSERRTPCQDSHPNCPTWAGWGECENNPGYMYTNCPETCGVCDTLINEISKDPPKGRCNDYNDKCAEWASWGECTKNPNYMIPSCTKSCGLCDGECVDLHKGTPGSDCKAWANSDECEVNPVWMLKNCKKSCKLC